MGNPHAFKNLDPDDFMIAKNSDGWWWLYKKQPFVHPDGTVYERKPGETEDFFWDQVLLVNCFICDLVDQAEEADLEMLKNVIVHFMNHAHRIGHEMGQDSKAWEIREALGITSTS